MIQLGGVFSRLLGPLLQTGLPLIKNVITPLVKSVLIRLGLTAAVLAADAGIDKKILGSGTTTLIISNDEMKNFINIVNSLEDSGLLLKGVSGTIQTEAKKLKGLFLCVLLGKLGVSVLGNILLGKGMNRVEEGFRMTVYGSLIKNKDF